MPDQSPPPSETPCKPAASDTLLIVEDDAVFADRLAKSLEDKGYLVRSASSISAAIDCVSDEPPAYAIVDMRLPDGNGLDFVSTLKKGSPDCRAVILTGYGNIPSAVVAVEAGAFDFLAKPADADEIHNALRTARHDEVLIPFTPASSDHVRRKHIDAVFEEYGQNVSETARRLSMHRRTLQRILGKNVPR